MLLFDSDPRTTSLRPLQESGLRSSTQVLVQRCYATNLLLLCRRSGVATHRIRIHNGLVERRGIVVAVVAMYRHNLIAAATTLAVGVTSRNAHNVSRVNLQDNDNAICAVTELWHIAQASKVQTSGAVVLLVVVNSEAWHGRCIARLGATAKIIILLRPQFQKFEFCYK